MKLLDSEKNKGFDNNSIEMKNDVCTGIFKSRRVLYENKMPINPIVAERIRSIKKEKPKILQNTDPKNNCETNVIADQLTNFNSQVSKNVNKLLL